ncbi:MAG: hypothetical protein QXI71_04400 [Candidatus Bathyarchaeia archaeon]
MSTDWIEVHDHDSVYKARVFLTDEDTAFIEIVKDGKRRFFRVDAKLLKLGELMFFERVMDGAEEITMSQAKAIGLSSDPI